VAPVDAVKRSLRKIPRLPGMLVDGRVRWGAALRDSINQGYDRKALQSDLMSGAVVAIVAVPLSMALAIATGVPPQHGLYTAIIAGFIVALLGGSRFQVSGPTAAFVVVLAPIASRHGLSGLLTAGFLAGVMLVIMGVARMGRLIEFIPHPVTTGFTAGIAAVILVLQLKDVFGLHVGPLPDAFPERVLAFWQARASVNLPDVGLALATLGLLLILPKLTRRIPAPLLALSAVTLLSVALTRLFPALAVDTVGSRFQTVIDGQIVYGIPQGLPELRLPWGSGLPSFALVRELLPEAFAIAMLGAIESLLSAVIADGMKGTRHDSNAELVALGVGNLLAPCFGGIAATGALARTATNVRSGAVSPIAAAAHALFVLVAVLAAAPLVAYIPMSALAGLLLLVAWNMADVRHVVHILKVAPRSDVLVMSTCFGLTVMFDMVVSVTAGVVFAALLFMRRMAELTQTRIFQGVPGEARSFDVPKRVALYEIAGPLFFGAASRGMAALDALRDDVRVVILDLSRVPVIDATGLVALESALERLAQRRRFAIIAGPLPEPRDVFDRASLERHHDNIIVSGSVQEALETARDLVLLSPEWGAGPPSLQPLGLHKG
jgi:sulfate permease, SulP family